MGDHQTANRQLIPSCSAISDSILYVLGEIATIAVLAAAFLLYCAVWLRLAAARIICKVWYLDHAWQHLELYREGEQPDDSSLALYCPPRVCTRCGIRHPEDKDKI